MTLILGTTPKEEGRWYHGLTFLEEMRRLEVRPEQDFTLWAFGVREQRFLSYRRVETELSDFRGI